MNSAYMSFDMIGMMYIQEQLKDKNMIYDMCRTYTTLYANEELSFREFLKMMVNMSITEKLPLMDILQIVEKLSLFDKTAKLKDTVRWKSVFHQNDALKFVETILSSKAMIELKDHSSTFLISWIFYPSLQFMRIFV